MYKRWQMVLLPFYFHYITLYFTLAKMKHCYPLITHAGDALQPKGALTLCEHLPQVFTAFIVFVKEFVSVRDP